MTYERGRLTIRLVSGETLMLLEPELPEGWSSMQWWGTGNVVMWVIECHEPRRTRHFPLVAIAWWEQCRVSEPASNASRRFAD